MSNKSVMVVRIQPMGNCQQRVISDSFWGIPGFPIAVSDDTGNTYTLNGVKDDVQSWYATERKAPTRIVLTFGNGDRDVRMI
jgi:hypothetical protein